MERADKIIAEFEGRFTQARAAHPEFAGTTLAYAGIMGPGKYYLDTSTRVRALVSGLGFVIPQEILDLTSESFFLEISQEQLRVLDRDVLLWKSLSSRKRAPPSRRTPFTRTSAVERRAGSQRDCMLFGALVAVWAADCMRALWPSDSAFTPARLDAATR